MKKAYFDQISEIVAEKAASMWHTVMATCPDSHLQEHIAEARTIARERGFVFNRVIWVDDMYAFMVDDNPVAIIKKTKDSFEIFSNYVEAT